MSKPKFHHIYAKAVDSNGAEHYVTVVAKVEQGTEKYKAELNGDFMDDSYRVKKGTLTFNDKRFYRTVTLGAAICNPIDTFDEEIGVHIATSRIKKGESIGSITTHDVTMLTEDAVEAELLVKVNHIVANIDDYIADSKL